MTNTYCHILMEADVAQTPVPRFDLLKVDDYAIIPIQFSRGCPFQCEFCLFTFHHVVPEVSSLLKRLAGKGNDQECMLTRIPAA